MTAAPWRREGVEVGFELKLWRKKSRRERRKKITQLMVSINYLVKSQEQKFLGGNDLLEILQCETM
jgi:hypothetical protein